MTTRLELLDELKAKIDQEDSFFVPMTAGTPDPDGRSTVYNRWEGTEGETVEWHGVGFWDEKALNVVVPKFHVYDRGTEDERAWWMPGTNPRPEPTDPTFQQELTAWLDTKIEDDTIAFYNIIGVLPNVERALVNVVLVQGTDRIKKEVGVYRDAQGEFKYTLVT